MEFRILGSFEAEADGVMLPLSKHERTVLAVLLLDSGRIIPVTRLVDALWEQDPPKTAAKQVRNTVSRLRAVLDSHGWPAVIAGDGVGYRIDVSAQMLDAARFEAKVAAAGAAAADGRAGEAAQILRSALELWRGPLLDGLAGPVIDAAAVGWEERRRAAQDAYYQHMLALGRDRGITAELSALLADNPLRERTAAQLMLALYRCGRQADALKVYQDTRARLADELGLDPGPGLQDLHLQILTQDPCLAYRPDDTGAPASSFIPRQLPAGTPSFTGRTDELKRLDEMLHEVTGGARAEDHATAGAGAVVITAIGGTAGVGKTALAIHWAHQVAYRFPDGQLYVNLRGFDPAGSPVTPAEAIHGFLDALGASAGHVPATLDGLAALYRSLLAGKRMLIVADNARDAGQVRPLLPGTPGCLVLATSRRQLTSLVTAEGARPVTLGLLSKAEAHDLLASRLGRQRTSRERQAAGELAEICARLPLALSIAAARAAAQPGRSLTDFTADLRAVHDRLDALSTGDPAADVRAVFSWSYDSLSEPAARMFRLLGCAPGPDISLMAAACLAGITPRQARVVLAELTQSHLCTEHVQGRFVSHDLLRAYAAEQASTTGADNRDAIRRVLDYYLHTSLAASRLADPKRPMIRLASPVLEDAFESASDAIRWRTAEHDALISALRHAAENGFDTQAWQLAWSIAVFLDRRGEWQELSETHRIALAATKRLGDPEGEAHIRRNLARACTFLGSYDEAHEHLRQALDLLTHAGDLLGQGAVHESLAITYAQQKLYQPARVHGEQALGIFEAAGDRFKIAHLLNTLGWCHDQLGDHHQALVCCGQALDISRSLGDRQNEAATQDSLGSAHHHLGDYAAALACYREALRLYRDMDIRYPQGHTLSRIGDTYASQGDLPTACQVWRQALSILQDARSPLTDEVRAKLGRPGGRGPGGTEPAGSSV
jgi:DNA-binding SARP family transcriptional activator/tetratricopeptide (TPR) repeat protein